jgi:DNA-binding PadR family transcriptional regulator
MHACAPHPSRRLIGLVEMTRRRHGHSGPRRRGGPRLGRHGMGMPRGPRARRGDVRTAILVLLAEEPRNGYQLMQEIEQRSEGAWRPSPGSVYPALQQLEDEGLVTAVEEEGRKAFALSDAGREAVAARGEDATAPWEAAREDLGEPRLELRGQMRQIGMALFQISQAGSAEQVAEARTVLADARRALYRILAEDEPREAEGS